ncbi:hypothetical protein RRF57_008845 [Xylaria bambusicola]|uniref:Uncharacterized protein n=1 Tax=Xylaria bambusicola TaxID=326684 RepID=A0AAN7UVZ5_9PEZI
MTSNSLLSPNSQPTPPFPNPSQQSPQSASINSDIALGHRINPMQPDTPKYASPHKPSRDGSGSSQEHSDAISAVEENGECLDVIRDDSPPETPRCGGHVVVPYYH